MNMRGNEGGMEVAEQNIGFRFDIYERIHLPDGILAIRDLEEIELTPYFQGIPGEEQTQLRGNLQLTAVYESKLEGAGKQTFIHRIPVEISLPVRTNDVSSQEIQVSIDQFDVELVTDRSLNVTGILSLSGWEQTQTESFGNDSEEFYAVHQLELDRSSEHHATQNQAPQLEATEESQMVPIVESQMEATEEATEEAKEEAKDEVKEESQQEANVKAAQLPNAESLEQFDAQPEQWIQAAVVDNYMDNEMILPYEQEVATPSEMKVAIKPQMQEELAVESPMVHPAKTEKANNSLEWKRLFSIKEDTVQFKRMRMCIVHKEDTLQSIADRYELQPREIALYNRLGEVDVSEGQIIYIPKSNV
jgi:stage VI sporulation protein D